jgi:hypothetical protein
MNWEIIFKIAVLCGGGFLTLVFLAITWRLIKTSSSEYKKMQRVSPSFLGTLLGCGSKFIEQENHRQRVFPVVNLENNQWEARAVLKESSVNEFIRG